MSDFTLSEEDRISVRDYITAKDDEHYAGLAEDMVAIIVTHSNLPAKFMDLRFNLHTTIEGIKERFRVHFGTPVDYQRLFLKVDDKIVCEMKDNSKKLGFFNVESGNVVHVVDEDPFSLSKNGGLTDTSLVEKYRMSEEDYANRKGSVREQIREQKLKKAMEKLVKGEKKGPAREVAPDEGLDSIAHVIGAEAVAAIKAAQAQAESEAAAAAAAAPAAEGDAAAAATAPAAFDSSAICSGLAVGSRCEVQPGARRGVVRWVGECDDLKSGYWVGVQFDEPVGRSDGSINGTVLFQCEAGYGGFIRGKNIAVGDFPEADPFADEDEEAEGACAGADKGCCGGDEAAGDDEI